MEGTASSFSVCEFYTEHEHSKATEGYAHYWYLKGSRMVAAMYINSADLLLITSQFVMVSHFMEDKLSKLGSGHFAGMGACPNQLCCAVE